MFSPTGNLGTARSNHAATRLENGQVLITGGGLCCGTFLNSAELYDPVAGTFSVTGNMAATRLGHTTTLLANGQVLVAAGFAGGASYLTSAELYDPSAGTFSATGNLATGRFVHTATLLNDGDVLIVGGFASSALASAELYTRGKLYQICSLYDQTKSVKGGSTVPIRLELCDSNGNDLSSSSITLHGVDLSPLSSEASAALEASGNANPDNDFRFDPTLGTSGGYIFNLSTKGLGSGTWGLNFTAGPTAEAHQVQFGVK
jgi:hypothetical protein